MHTTTAINMRTGQTETVTVDGRGLVPAGYRTLTDGERWVSRVASLREEMAGLEARGDVTGAEQVRRTLDDMGAP